MKITRSLILIWILSYPCYLYAQLENVWAFGYHTGLDFGNGMPIAINTSIDSREGTASICNTDGQLLFYTEGTYVWDKNGTLMPNGNNLTPIPPFGSPPTLTSATSSTSQGSVIVPVPGHSQQYYIFSLTSAETGINAGRLYYSKVDMDLNGGLGDVVPGQKGLLLDSLLFEKMGAVAGDHCNYWLMVCGQDLVFRAYEVTDMGIATVPVLSPGAIGLGGTGFIYGNLVFSPDRHRLAATQSNASGMCANGAALYDFDPATGIVSNGFSLLPSSLSAGYGICFAPDNSKLYVNVVGDSICQFDLAIPYAPAIVGSKTGIAGFTPFTAIKMGPDGKLYFGCYGLYDLSLIAYPDMAGTACGYISAGVSLQSDTSFYIGLPNVVPAIPHDAFYSRYAVAAPCFGGGFVLTAPGADTVWDYVWNTGAATASINPVSSGTYWVSYRTPPCNFHTDTFEVTFPDGVLPTIAIDAACAGASNGAAQADVYPGDTVAYHYAWMNAAGDTLSLTSSLAGVAGGTYALHIATAACDTILMVTIPAIEDSVSFMVSDILVCTDEQLTFQNTSVPGYTGFVWQFGDGNISEASSPVYQYANSGAYTACLIGQGSICSDTACRVILVDAPVDSFRFQSDRYSLCSGQHVVLNAVTDSTLTGYDWSFGDGAGFYIDKNITEHAYDKEGIYIINLRGRFRACPDQTVTDTIHVYSLPEVQLSPDTTLCLGGSPIHLENLMENTESCHYEWSTGDTTTSIEVRHPGIYSLTVKQEPAGCAATDMVTINKDCYMDIPNAFTPNGDGANDYFFPRQYLSKHVTHFRMQVLNRWGQKVFETTSIEGRGWDGRFNDKEQPAGVYVYLIDVTIDNEHQGHYQGNVTLLR